MDKIKLFDGTVLDIEDSASLDHIVHIAKTAAKAKAAADAFTAENLRHVEFLHGENINGIYDNLALVVYEAPAAEEGMEPQAPKANPLIDGKTVTIALCQM